MAAGVQDCVVEAQRAKLRHAPGHDSFAAHSIPELRLPFQDKDTRAVLGHSLGQRRARQTAANGNDVVSS